MGDSALSTEGSPTTLPSPKIASEPNQAAITGPKKRPSGPVPKRWTKNSVERITSVTGTTIASRFGVTTSRPSTADITEIAGVIIPSP